MHEIPKIPLLLNSLGKPCQPEPEMPQPNGSPMANGRLRPSQCLAQKTGLDVTAANVAPPGGRLARTFKLILRATAMSKGFRANMVVSGFEIRNEFALKIRLCQGIFLPLVDTR